MNSTFRALWANNTDSNPDDFAHIRCELRSTPLTELSAGNVVVKVHYTGINYKDALAITGKGKILRQLPLVPGIDLSGEVVQSSSLDFAPGDRVLTNGCNMGEKFCGGFAEYARVSSDNLIKIPPEMSTREAMILGTAGFTAALAIHQMEVNGLTPAKGVVLVTGATGGVGSLALSLLNQLGYETEAWTRRKEHSEWLELCGAGKVTITDGWNFKTRPLESVSWSGAIDNVGGEVLSYILPRVDLWGSVASIGMAKSDKLSTTVFPFILRGVNILGVSSNNCPFSLRKEIWQKLAGAMKPKNLEHICTREIGLDQVVAEAQTVFEGKHLGRVLVNIGDR